jgi:protein CpxP
METMHSLVTAENFDETAVKALTEKMVQEHVTRQIEMAKVRNQMYHLLTPEQQAVLAQKHRQIIDKYRELSDRQQSNPLQIMSSK